jgi:RloB-like protein
MIRRNRVRRESDLRRRGPTRRPRECILLACEGAETEPNYLKSLRRKIGLRTVDVEIVGQGAEIVGVVDEAIRLREERAAEAEQSNQRAPFDEIWCVVDTECRNDNPSWEKGVDRANATGLRLAWSNPCFEFWLLLHFELIGRSFAGYAAVRPFLSKYIKHYQKSTDCFEQLAPRVPMAIDHSKRIHRSQWQDTPKFIDCNPATTVHELVERLLEVAGMTVDDYRRRFPLPDEGPPKGKRTGRS